METTQNLPQPNYKGRILRFPCGLWPTTIPSRCYHLFEEWSTRLHRKTKVRPRVHLCSRITHAPNLPRFDPRSLCTLKDKKKMF